MAGHLAGADVTPDRLFLVLYTPLGCFLLLAKL